MQALVLAADFAKRKKHLSRRNFVLSLAAGAPAVLRPKPARAQGDVWREYRPADLPSRIEMPGEPKLETEKNDHKDDDLIKSVDAEVDYEQANFGAHWTEWKTDKSIDLVSSSFREGMQRAGMGSTSEAPLTVSGFAAREFIRRSNDFNYICRFIGMEKGTLQVSVMGQNDSIHGSPSARRFFDSLKLLPSPR
jgi:hypothetical protein